MGLFPSALADGSESISEPALATFPLHNKNVLLMDVRPSAEFEVDHITGAVSIPMNDMLCCLKDFSKDQEIIAYCRGPFCVLADEAVKVLSENGFKVRRLDEGYPEWKIRQLESNQSS